MLLSEAHVNWATRPADERFQSLPQLHDAVQADYGRSWQEGVVLGTTPKRMDDGSLGMFDAWGANPHLMTHWSSGQVLRNIGVPRELAAALSQATANLVLHEQWKKYRDARAEESPVALVTAGDDGRTVMRSLVSQSYEWLPSYRVTEALLPLHGSKWRNPVAYEGGNFGAPLAPSGLYAGDRNMFAFLIDGGDAIDLAQEGGFGFRHTQIHHGLFVSNSEVGERSLNLKTFMFDYVCGNNFVWGARGLRMYRARHTGKAASNLLDEIRLMVDRMLSGDVSMFDKGLFIETAQQAQKKFLAPVGSLVELDKERYGILGAKGFTRGEVDRALQCIVREEQQATGSVWDWVQGFTAAARTIEYADARLDLEQRASALLPKE